MGRLSQRERLGVVAFYVVLVVVCSYIATGQLPYHFSKDLWFVDIFFGLIIASALLQPFFTKPVDALSNAVTALLATWGAEQLVPLAVEPVSFAALRCFFVLVILLAAFAIVTKGPKARTPADSPNLLSAAATRVCDIVGAPEVLYSLAFYVAALQFAEDRYAFFVLLFTWFLVAVLRVGERGARVIQVVRARAERRVPQAIAETVEWHEPDIVVGRVFAASSPVVGEEVIVLAEGHSLSRGIVFGLTPVRDGKLVKVRLTEGQCAVSAQALAPGYIYEVDEQLAKSLQAPGEAEEPAFQGNPVGVIDEGSEVAMIRVDLLPEADSIEVGDLVAANVRGSEVLYQVVNGVTREERSAEGSTRGFVRAQARKVGRWNGAQGTFEAVPWVPDMNEVVYQVADRGDAREECGVGRLPGTNFWVDLDMNELVTHNAAILGILGVGKTFLALELIDRMIREDVRVLVLDVSDEYQQQLSHHDWDHDSVGRIAESIERTRDQSYEKEPHRGGNYQEFRQAVREEVDGLLKGNDMLRIWSPAAFDVTEQNRQKFKPVIETLTPAQVTAVITEGVFDVLSASMSDTARLCIVYEEAHSLVPEWSSASFEGEKTAVNRTAKTIMQGRKYGLGCLVVTQRTANVTKSILNQCNTVFAMRVFDATAMEFLSNYLGHDYAGVLNGLQDRQAVVFGRASSCKEPVIVRLNDREDFLQATGASLEPCEDDRSQSGEVQEHERPRDEDRPSRDDRDSRNDDDEDPFGDE